MWLKRWELGGLLSCDCEVILYGFLDSFHICSDNGFDELTVLVDEESGHGGDAQLGGEVRALINIDLEEGDLSRSFLIGSESLAVFLQHGLYHSARATPAQWTEVARFGQSALGYGNGGSG